MTIQDRADAFWEALNRDGTEVHHADWERNTNVWTIPLSKWEGRDGLKWLAERAYMNDDMLDCFSREELPKQDTAMDCIIGLSYGDDGELDTHSGDTYTLYGRCVDYDGIKECSNAITPNGQVGWIRFYNARVSNAQWYRCDFSKSDYQREQYYTRVYFERYGNEPTNVIVIVKD